MRHLFLSLILLASAAGSCLAGGPSSNKILDLWDIAYLQGGRAGYIHTVTEEFEVKDQKIWRTTVELRLKVKRFTDTIDLAMDTGSEETPEGKVLGVFMRQYLGKTKTLDIQGIVVGDELKLLRDSNQALKPAPWNKDVVGLYRQQQMLRERQVKPGDQFSYPSFEPSINLVLNTDVAVKNFEEVEIQAGKPKQRLLRVESKPERIEKVQLPTLISWLDKELKQVRGEVEIAGLGRMILYRSTKEAALSPSTEVVNLTDIGISQLIRLSSRITRPYDTVAATYRIKIRDDDDPASAFATDARQKIRKLDGKTIEVSLRASQGPQAGGTEPAPTAEYTQSSYFITSDDVKVKALARRAVDQEADVWRKALRIERWVHENMKSRNHEALATADHVARTLEGDCTEYAMLTAAMCRAEGIPSRTAVGLIYADVKEQPTFAFHMWTEVWIRGEWIPIDATLGKGYVGATHLKITAQSWHDTRTLTPLFPVVRVLGRISIEVLEVRGR